MPASEQRLHVAVGVILNNAQQVLISRRPDHLHMGGLWEFPGGKLEDGESVEQALKRELHEELGIDIQSAAPLIRIPYNYPDRSVLLDVWTIEEFHGEPHGREDQPVQWVGKEALSHFAFPPANLPIIHAVQLPDIYLITGEFSTESDFLQRLERALQRGIRLVQLRAKHLDEPEFCLLAAKAFALCRNYHAHLLLNCTSDWFSHDLASGLHLSSERLMTMTARPVSRDVWLAASVHDQQQLVKALSIGVDFVVLGPVKATTTHPEATPLGWENFHHLVEQSTLPVFALGGMQPEDVQPARQHGAQGIAAISAYWKAS